LVAYDNTWEPVPTRNVRQKLQHKKSVVGLTNKTSWGSAWVSVSICVYRYHVTRKSKIIYAIL